MTSNFATGMRLIFLLPSFGNHNNHDLIVLFKILALFRFKVTRSGSLTLNEIMIALIAKAKGTKRKFPCCLGFDGYLRTHKYHFAALLSGA